MGNLARAVAFFALSVVAAWVLYTNFFRPPSWTFGLWAFSYFPPIHAQRGPGFVDFHAVEVLPGSPAAKAGIVPGDRVRIFARYPEVILFPVAHSSVRVLLSHAGTVRDAVLRATPMSGAFEPGDMVLLVIGLVQVGLGFLLVWKRWNNRDARALTLYFGANAWALAPSLLVYPFGALEGPIRDLSDFCAYGALALFAASYPSESVHARVRAAIATYGPIAAIALGAFLFGNDVSYFWFGPALDLSIPYHYGTLFFASLLPCIGLVAGVLTAAQPHRARLGILLWFFLLSVTGAVAFDFLFSLGIPFVTIRPLLSTLLIMDIGFVYVILRHRLFDLSFVLNRAAIYAVLTTIFVPLFALFEWLAERYVLSQNRTANALVQVGIALVLFMSIRRAHSYAERFVDQWLFRERHENDQALRTFARHVAFITDSRTIADRSAQLVCTKTNASWSAVYTREGSSPYYQRRSACGDLVPPATIAENDPAIVGMRADRAASEHPENSVIGDALVLPLLARGQLAGFMACGPKRSGESFAPDERETLLHVAHEVASALDGVRLTALEREVARLHGGLSPAKI